MKYLVTLTRVRDIHDSACIEVEAPEHASDFTLAKIARALVEEEDWEDPILDDDVYIDYGEVRIIGQDDHE